MPLLAQLVRALDCGSGGFGSIPKFGTMTNVRVGLHFYAKKPMGFDSPLGLAPGKTSYSFLVVNQRMLFNG